MWSNAKKFVGGALAALVAAALALAVAAVPAEALELCSGTIYDVGTYSLDIGSGYWEGYLTFELPESGAYCIEFSWAEGDLDYVLCSMAIAEVYDSEGNYVGVESGSELYQLAGGGYDTDDTSTVAIYQLEGGVSYDIYLNYIGYDASATIELTVTRVGTDAEDTDFVPVWRVYNPYSGEHHFTVDQNEYSTLVSLGWTGEGVCWLAPTTGDAVYRLYNQWSGDHHYTTDANEYAALLALGWTDEGIGWYSAGADDEGAVAVYRLYNPYASAFYHHYTTDANENSTLASLGWEKEGTGWYGL